MPDEKPHKPLHLLELFGEDETTQFHLARFGDAWGVFRRCKEGMPERVVEAHRKAADLARKLRHPHVVRTLARSISKESRPYTLETFVSKVLLEELRDLQVACPWEIACELVRMAALGVEHVLSECPAESFGITAPHRFAMTEEGDVILVDPLQMLRNGTLDDRRFGYLAPELLRGTPPDERSHVFALGVILWELCAGERLFNASTMDEAKDLIGYPVIDRLQSKNAAVPGRLDDVLQAALARDPTERFSSPEVFAVALESVLAGQKPNVGSYLRRSLAHRFHRTQTWLDELFEMLSERTSVDDVVSVDEDLETAAAPPVQTRTASGARRFTMPDFLSPGKGIPAVAGDTLKDLAGMLQPSAPSSTMDGDDATIRMSRSDIEGQKPPPKHLMPKPKEFSSGRYVFVAREEPEIKPVKDAPLIRDSRRASQRAPEVDDSQTRPMKRSDVERAVTREARGESHAPVRQSAAPTPTERSQPPQREVLRSSAPNKHSNPPDPSDRRVVEIPMEISQRASQAPKTTEIRKISQSALEQVSRRSVSGAPSQGDARISDPAPHKPPASRPPPPEPNESVIVNATAALKPLRISDDFGLLSGSTPPSKRSGRPSGGSLGAPASTDGSSRAPRAVSVRPLEPGDATVQIQAARSSVRIIDVVFFAFSLAMVGMVAFLYFKYRDLKPAIAVTPTPVTQVTPPLAPEPPPPQATKTAPQPAVEMSTPTPPTTRASAKASHTPVPVAPVPPKASAKASAKATAEILPQVVPQIADNSAKDTKNTYVSVICEPGCTKIEVGGHSFAAPSVSKVPIAAGSHQLHAVWTNPDREKFIVFLVREGESATLHPTP